MYRPAKGLATGVAVLAVASALAAGGVAFTEWGLLATHDDYFADVASISDLGRAFAYGGFAIMLTGVCSLATTVLPVLWSWRSRRNAEVLSAARHRFPRGWAIGGWFCPFANLVIPPMVVDDVYRVSRPDTPGATPSTDKLRPALLVWAWWALFTTPVVHQFGGPPPGQHGPGRSPFLLELGRGPAGRDASHDPPRNRHGHPKPTGVPPSG